MTANCWLVDTELAAEAPRGLAKARKTPKDTPIIIDFGSWQCRAGFGNEEMPALVFDQTVHRMTDREGSVYFAVGRNPPASANRSSSRSPFESGLVVHFTSVERILDHIFDHLKLTDNTVTHPIIITEPIGNPSYIREEFIELLCEGYRVPRVAFVDDMLPAVAYNLKGVSAALVISVGHSSTHVVIYADSKLQKTKRLNFGGLQAAELLLKMIQCKYPTFPVKMSLPQAANVLWKACSVAEDYLAALAELETTEGIAKNDFVIQFPYPIVDKVLIAEREKQAAALKEKRREMAERLRERAAVKRMEKLKSKDDHLKALQHLLSRLRPSTGKGRPSLLLESDDELVSDSVTDDVMEEEQYEELRIHGFESLTELEEAIICAKKDLQKYKDKLEGVEESRETPAFDLLDIPDEQLDEEQQKEKRKQRLLKASADARERIRLEKEQQAKVNEERAKKDEEWRLSDFEAWKSHYYLERAQLMARIQSRQKQREALADRRSAASSIRLRNVMSLVDDDSEPESQGKRKKAKRGVEKQRSREQLSELDRTVEEIGNEDDGFGAKDSDWQIYRQIRRDELSDEEDDERDQERLWQIEAKLEDFDPTFYDVLADELSQRATIIDLLKNGGRTAPVNGEEADAAAYQIHVNVERFRVPEVYFQPQIAGIYQAGLVEIICGLLKDEDPEMVASLLNNVFLCGGMCQLPGLEARLGKDLTQCFPVGTNINITKQSSTLDTWKGLAAGYGDLNWLANKNQKRK